MQKKFYLITLISFLTLRCAQEAAFEAQFDAALAQEEGFQEKYQKDLYRIERTLEKLQNLKRESKRLLDEENQKMTVAHVAYFIKYYLDVINHAFENIQDAGRKNYLKRRILKMPEYFDEYRAELKILNKAIRQNKKASHRANRAINHLIDHDIDYAIAVFVAMRERDSAQIEYQENPKAEKKAAKEVRFAQ